MYFQINASLLIKSMIYLKENFIHYFKGSY